jgi:hypothetical protein
MNITQHRDPGDEQTERIPGTDWAVVRDESGRIRHIYLCNSDQYDADYRYQHGDEGEKEGE